MKIQRKRRLLSFFWVSSCLVLALVFILIALQKQANLYLTPHEVKASHKRSKKTLRLGGVVKIHSLKSLQGLKMQFVIEDLNSDDQIPVLYQGLLPALFKEGRGVVIEGHFNKKDVFFATRVLAKHDEYYAPPMKKY